MKELTIKKYIADDGVEFDNQDDCINYESRNFEVMCENMKSMKHVLINQSFISDIEMGGEDYILAIKPMCYDEVCKVEEWFNWNVQYDEPMVIDDRSKYIGYILLFHCHIEDGNWMESAPTINEAMPIAFLGTAEDYIYSITGSVHKLVELVHNAERK